MKKYVLFLFTLLSGFISTSQTLPAYLPSNGLVGWWPFNGNANDESGNNLNGIVNNGPTLSADRFGDLSKAYTFANVGQYITFPAPSNNTFTNSMSYSIWYKEIPNTDYVNVFNTTGNKALVLNPGGFGLHANDGNSFYLEANSSALQANSWKHICAVYQGQVISVYINGVLANSGTTGFSATIQYPSTQSVAGTTYLGGGQYPFSGQIDDIAIYNRALTQEEITSLYTGEPANPPTACNPLPSNLQNGLVGYWPFCGNANDESGNGNDGTVNGATLTEDRFGAANAAYNFDGGPNLSSDNITINNPLINEPNFSISYWAKSDTVKKYGYPIMIESENETYEFLIFDDTTAFVNFNRSNGTLNLYFEYPNTVNPFQVSNYLFSYDGLEFKFYLNGQIISSIPISNILLPADGLVFIGKHCCFLNDVQSGYKGTLDDIGIWNRALSADEVQELYTLNACTFTIYDTVTVNNYVTVYDTVSVSTTDTLIINTLITAVQPAQENTFLVYPNPAHSQITIDNGNWSILGGYSIRIVNSAAQEVYNAPINQQTETIALNGWGGNGLYVLYIIDPQQQIVAVKQIVLE